MPLKENFRGRGRCPLSPSLSYLQAMATPGASRQQPGGAAPPMETPGVPEDTWGPVFPERPPRPLAGSVSACLLSQRSWLCARLTRLSPVHCSAGEAAAAAPVCLRGSLYFPGDRVCGSALSFVTFSDNCEITSLDQSLWHVSHSRCPLARPAAGPVAWMGFASQGPLATLSFLPFSLIFPRTFCFVPSNRDQTQCPENVPEEGTVWMVSDRSDSQAASNLSHGGMLRAGGACGSPEVPQMPTVKPPRESGRSSRGVSTRLCPGLSQPPGAW